jgi:hypothetical protein
MTIANEVSFVAHCDEPGCGLGSAEFDCPACGRPDRDFGDLFYAPENSEESVKISCSRCGVELIAERQTDWTWMIRVA